MAPRPITKPRCHNCRRKKIELQCDYGRPECSQCKRCNLQCDGYVRDLIFVNSEIRSPSPPSTTKSRTASATGAEKSATPSGASSSGSSEHGSSPDPPTLTTIEFYHTPPPAPARPRQAATSPCKFLSSLNIFDIPEIRTRFKPLDIAICAVLTATSSYTQPKTCYSSQSQSLYSQALFELRESKQRSDLRPGSWHNTAFTSLMLQLVEAIDGGNTPIVDWLSHSDEISNMPPMSSIQQFGAPDILTLTFCRTAMLARDLFEGCQPLEPDVWYLQSWGEAANDDLHRVLDGIALLPSHIQQADLTAINPYDGSVRFDFEQQHKHLTALLQGLYATQNAWGDFAPWVMQPYETFNACTNSDISCMSVDALTNEKVRCSVPLTPESMNQSIEGDIEWLLMLETMNSMQHALTHCITVDSSLVGMQTIIIPLRMLTQFATSYNLVETQD